MRNVNDSTWKILRPWGLFLAVLAICQVVAASLYVRTARERGFAWEEPLILEVKCGDTVDQKNPVTLTVRVRGKLPAEGIELPIKQLGDGRWLEWEAPLRLTPDLSEKSLLIRLMAGAGEPLPQTVTLRIERPAGVERIEPNQEWTVYLLGEAGPSPKRPDPTLIIVDTKELADQTFLGFSDSLLRLLSSHSTAHSRPSLTGSEIQVLGRDGQLRVWNRETKFGEDNGFDEGQFAAPFDLIAGLSAKSITVKPLLIVWPSTATPDAAASSKAPRGQRVDILWLLPPETDSAFPRDWLDGSGGVIQHFDIKTLDSKIWTILSESTP